MQHISQNKREHARKDYYKSDDSNIIYQVETQITEVHLDKLIDRINELESCDPNYFDSALEEELTYKKNLLSSLTEE